MLPASVKWLLGLMLVVLTAQASAMSTEDPDPELRAALKAAVSSSDSFGDRFDAEVWLMDMSGRLLRYRNMKDENVRLDFLRLVHQEARRADLQPELVLSVIQIESAFDRFALSYVGAQGYMQVMPFWKDEIGRPEDNLMDTATNLRYGCTILRHYLDREKGNISRALARYNGSLGKIKYPEKVLMAWDKHWFVGQ
ncbi:MAG TPA: hypothetical protein DEA26_02680 [Oceanospirillales bacterium]|nr:hypothetical protein [Oceanospirillaceae bacterium]HBS41560.1 hypothetical protein [Oceanospirillales bacterium]|tara:strand:- start:28736 stop:29323 length:588 start_codon:yes stop_codon:yes gene_type:complete